jgi:hypothetical protein
MTIIKPAAPKLVVSRRKFIRGAALVIAAPAIIRPSKAFMRGGFNSGVTYNDGFANAPTGTAQFPSLLSGYAVRAPWYVAGVNYRVGINTSVTLLNPSTIPTSGNISRSGTVITLAGNGTVLDSYDFSLGGGFMVSNTGTNCVIQNCNFDASGANANTQNGSGNMIFSSAFNSNLTVQYCELNGGGPTGLATEILHNVNNVSYCYIHDAPNDFAEYAIPAVWRFNLMRDAGVAPGSHADFFQIGGAGAGAWNYDVQFNTTYQSGNNGPYGGSQGTQGYSFEPNSPGTVTGVLAFCTAVAIAGGGQADFVGVRSNPTGAGNSNVVAPGISVHDNYVDPTGMSSFYLTTSNNNNAGALVTFTDNVNMVTGSLEITNGAHS